MEMLVVVSIGALGFATALGLAPGALDVLFSALAPMTPAPARQAVAQPRRPDIDGQLH